MTITGFCSVSVSRKCVGVVILPYVMRAKCVTAELCARQSCEGSAAALQACSYVGVSCICMTVLGVRIAVCCTEAMFSGRASSTDGS